MQHEFIPIRQDHQIQQLAELAEQIWRQHFTPIIGTDQVTYMLEQFQSFEAVKKAIQQDGYQYYFITCDGENAGYTGIRIGDDHKLFLSKLYIKQEHRGKKLASRAMQLIETIARENRCTAVWLTCNRGNEHTLQVYRHTGFSIIREEDNAIGNGYFMNDYILEKPITL